jgi:hypothetical protein
MLQKMGGNKTRLVEDTVIFILTGAAELSS